jgi:hypothetical protein
MASGKLKMLRMDAGNIGTTVLIADIGPTMVAGESLWNHGLLYDPEANVFFVWGSEKVYNISASSWAVNFASVGGAHPVGMSSEES